jgi:Heparinase II/III-like protein
VETYSRKTFSPQRYEIWTMQSAYHSLPTIDGVMEAPGAQFKASQVAYAADAHRVKFSLDIAGAYPPEAKLVHWLRTITFERDAQYIQVEDRYELSAPARELTLSLLTPCKVQLGQPGELLLMPQPLAGGRQSGSGKIAFDSECLAVTTENIPIGDNQLRQVWGEQLVRILFKATLAPSLTGGWTIKISEAA